MSEVHSIKSMSDEAFGWYLSGFVDGEGFFTCNAWKNREQNPKFDPSYIRQWAVRFGIKLRGDDSTGLRAIAARVGVGTIQVRGEKGRDNPQISWQVNRQSDLARVIIPLFERFPLQMKKARDFAIWKQCVQIMYAKNCRPWPAGQVGGKPSLTAPELVFMREATAYLKSLRQYDSSLAPGPMPVFKPAASAGYLFDPQR